MASIQFDSTEILNTTYVPRFVKHESAPEREMQSLVSTREDGEVLIFERYGKKRIELKGYLVGTSQADLESKIDAFKELFSRPEKNLDIDWNGSTRRYVASCRQHEFDRDHFNILFVPWTASFEIFSGEGKDTSATLALNAHAVTLTTPGSDSFTLSGSKPPKPVITLTGSNWSTSEIKGVEYKNTDTGERIIFTKNSTWVSNSIIEIDCDLKRVRNDINLAFLVESGFYGVFPKFKIGTNNVLITAGGIVNQTSPDTSTLTTSTETLLNSTSKRRAQAFSIPYADDTFQGAILQIDKTGSPGDITVRIETDNSGKPSGSLAHANATLTITAGSVSGSLAYVTGYASSTWSLSANTKYWIVVSAASVDGSNYYGLGLPDSVSVGTYAKGIARSSDDSGGTWSDTTGGSFLSFRLLFGGKRGSSQGCTHTVSYKKTYL